jgi:MoaA/NifB/PqqE/SkfB family radical SAM enzyme
MSLWSRLFGKARAGTRLSSLLGRATNKLLRMTVGLRWASRWESLVGSRRILRILRQHFDASVPPVVNIEVNTECNYKCPFCPQSLKPRPVRHMTMEGFKHVVDELKRLDYSNYVVLNVNNESFLHPLVIDFCRLISEELPKASAQIVSNGSLITKQHLEALSGLEHPPMLIVDDYTPDHRVNARLSEWMTDPAYSRLRLQLKDRSWKESLTNRGGNLPGSRVPLTDCHDIGCSWPFYGMFIDPDLRVFLCCADYNFDVIVGDLNKQGLMEVWTGKSMQRIREALLIPDRTKIPLCAACDTTKVDWPKNINDLKKRR